MSIHYGVGALFSNPQITAMTEQDIFYQEFVEELTQKYKTLLIQRAETETTDRNQISFLDSRITKTKKKLFKLTGNMIYKTP